MLNKDLDKLYEQYKDRVMPLTKFYKFDKEKPIRKRDLILAGLSEKVVEDE